MYYHYMITCMILFVLYNNLVDYIYQVNNRVDSRWTGYRKLTANSQQKVFIIASIITSSLLTRRRAAGTAGLWQCGLTAAAPGQRWAGWRARWRGNSGNPGTPGSPCRCADTQQTAGGAPDPGPERTPEETTLFKFKWVSDKNIFSPVNFSHHLKHHCSRFINLKKF